ncbi:MAG: hypothetical protein DI566_04560 [Microbacterium sp.]|nr:MAG: hypothetical protein DI566_04560 [Microbacterium sp.]
MTSRPHHVPATLSAREIARRAGIWSVVALFFAAGFCAAFAGSWSALIGFSAYAIVGAVILTQRPGNGVGRYLLAIAASAVLLIPFQIPGMTATLPAGIELALWVFSAIFWPLVLMLTLLIPTGRIDSTLGRFALAGTAVQTAVIALASLIDPAALSVSDGAGSGRENPLAVPGATAVLSWISTLTPFVMLALFAAYVVDMVLRWRRADGVERLQFRWFVLGVGAMLVVVVAGFIATSSSPEFENSPLLVTMYAALSFPPIAIGIAVTRHGLYEIGRIVSRTISYLVVLGVALAVYAGVVVGVGALFRGGSQVIVAIATLAAAAVCLPLLRIVQRRLDRAFDRERYDAQRVLERFGEHVRDDADPGRARPELLGAIDQTLQPTAMGVWMRTVQ